MFWTSVVVCTAVRVNVNIEVIVVCTVVVESEDDCAVGAGDTTVARTVAVMFIVDVMVERCSVDVRVSVRMDTVPVATRARQETSPG